MDTITTTDILTEIGSAEHVAAVVAGDADAVARHHVLADELVRRGVWQYED